MTRREFKLQAVLAFLHNPNMSPRSAADSAEVVCQVLEEDDTAFDLEEEAEPYLVRHE
jgi:hypothetical protein